MGASQSNLQYTPVSTNLPIVTIDSCHLPPSVDLRTRKLSHISRRSGVHSAVYAVLSCLVMECERNRLSFVLPSMASISESMSLGGNVNPDIVVNSLNLGTNPESDSDDDSESVHCNLPFITLQRVECDTETIQMCLAHGRPVICTLRVSEDTLEEGSWQRSRNNPATLCCCISGYTSYSSEFIVYEVVFSKKRQLCIPFKDFESNVVEAFILDSSTVRADDPMFIS